MEQLNPIKYSYSLQVRGSASARVSPEGSDRESSHVSGRNSPPGRTHGGGPQAGRSGISSRQLRRACIYQIYQLAIQCK